MTAAPAPRHDAPVRVAGATRAEFTPAPVDFGAPGVERCTRRSLLWRWIYRHGAREFAAIGTTRRRAI
jgi:hypothetical protein